MTGRTEPHGFYIASGILFGLAIIAAILRTITRWLRFRHFCIDDYLFFLAVLELIGGTTLLYINVPLAYNQEQVGSGEVAPAPDFIETTIQNERTQFASSTLLGACIMAVKFSFLAFFLMIIRGGNPYYRWWWRLVGIITIAAAPMVMFSDFIACPYFGEDILTKCVSPEAMEWESRIVKASVAMDVISDVFIISIPVVLLWNLHTELRKKLVLALSLCMGVFMIVCAAVRVGTADLPNGQIDVLWTLLWQQLEACVAVIVVSLTAFRMLFTSPFRTDLNYGTAKSRPTRRDRYEIDGWLGPSRRSETADVRKLGKQMSENQKHRDSSQSLNTHEMGPVRYQNLG